MWEIDWRIIRLSAHKIDGSIAACYSLPGWHFETAKATSVPAPLNSEQHNPSRAHSRLKYLRTLEHHSHTLPFYCFLQLSLSNRPQHFISWPMRFDSIILWTYTFVGPITFLFFQKHQPKKCICLHFITYGPCHCATFFFGSTLLTTVRLSHWTSTIKSNLMNDRIQNPI